MGATNMRVPGRNIYMSVHGGVSTNNFVYTNIFVCRFSRIQYPKNQPIDASWHDSCHIASGPCIVVPAYLFIQACSFLRLFRHNFWNCWLEPGGPVAERRRAANMQPPVRLKVEWDSNGAGWFVGDLRTEFNVVCRTCVKMV